MECGSFLNIIERFLRSEYIRYLAANNICKEVIIAHRILYIKYNIYNTLCYISKDD